MGELGLKSFVDVLGVPFVVSNYDEVSETIIRSAQDNISLAVYALPVHGVIEARVNDGFRLAVDKADVIVPDGQPIRWFMNFFCSAGLRDRIYGPFLMEAVLAKAEGLGLRVFIYGGATQKLQLDFIEFINTRFPNVTVCGHYREKSASTLTLTAETVTASKADLVLVGLGCPNQELWISKQKGLINSPMLGVGAAFSFYAGHTEMAPKWMQSSGLEWFHRLMSEPRRLWFRYCFTNGFFIMLVLREYVSWVFSKLRG